MESLCCRNQGRGRASDWTCFYWWQKAKTNRYSLPDSLYSRYRHEKSCATEWAWTVEIPKYIHSHRLLQELQLAVNIEKWFLTSIFLDHATTLLWYLSCQQDSSVMLERCIYVMKRNLFPITHVSGVTGCQGLTALLDHRTAFVFCFARVHN